MNWILFHNGLTITLITLLSGVLALHLQEKSTITSLLEELSAQLRDKEANLQEMVSYIQQLTNENSRLQRTQMDPELAETIMKTQPMIYSTAFGDKSNEEGTKKSSSNDERDWLSVTNSNIGQKRSTPQRHTSFGTTSSGGNPNGTNSNVSSSGYQSHTQRQKEKNDAHSAGGSNRGVTTNAYFPSRNALVGSNRAAVLFEGGSSPISPSPFGLLGFKGATSSGTTAAEQSPPQKNFVTSTNAGRSANVAVNTPLRLTSGSDLSKNTGVTTTLKSISPSIRHGISSSSIPPSSRFSAGSGSGPSISMITSPLTPFNFSFANSSQGQASSNAANVTYQTPGTGIAGTTSGSFLLDSMSASRLTRLGDDLQTLARKLDNIESSKSNVE